MLDVVLPAGSRVALARRAWGMRRGRSPSSATLPPRGHVIEVDLPPGTELNVDGELLDDGMDRVTARAGAFELVVP